MNYIKISKLNHVYSSEPKYYDILPQFFLLSVPPKLRRSSVLRKYRTYVYILFIL